MKHTALFAITCLFIGCAPEPQGPEEEVEQASSALASSEDARVETVQPNACRYIYQDSDGDGYGATSTKRLYCRTPIPTGWVTVSGDCCDVDALTHPGQTAYFTTTNGCGYWDYNCDSSPNRQSNGPTDCFDALECWMVGDTCVTNTPPPDCNGHFTDYDTAMCGETWYISATGCTTACTPGGCQCVGWSNGGPGGTQACH